MRRIIALLLPALLAATAAVPSTASPEDRTTLSVISGAFDITKDGVEHPEIGFEVRFAPRTLGFLPQRFPIRPTLGGAGTGLGSFWTYAGFRLENKVGRWVFTPGLAVTLYERGRGLDLGGTLEFRSSFEASTRIVDGLSVGVVFYHLSNARLYERNPGSESMVVTVTAPLPL